MNEDNRNNNIVRLYSEEKMTLEAVGKHYGISRERVRQILVSRGITERHNGKFYRVLKRDKLAARAFNWRRLHNATREKTAKHFGISTHYLNSILYEAGLTERKIVPEHGVQAYNKGCHCEICKEAHNARMKEYLKGLPTYRNRPWGKKDEQFLLENYKTMGPTKIGEILYRSASACGQRYRKLVNEANL